MKSNRLSLRLVAAFMLVVALVCGFAAASAPACATPALATQEEEPAELGDLSAATASVDDQTYTGVELKPAVVVALDDVTLTEGVDYLVSYSDNVEIGTATARVEGIGGYTGSLEVTFEILPHPEGWDKINNIWYYFTNEGTRATNRFAQAAAGAWYYLGEDGTVLTSRWVQDDEDKYYYLGTNGRPVTSNWVKSGATYYYMDGHGNPTVNAWVITGGKYYYMDANGHPLVSTSLVYNGVTYCFNSKGVLMTNSWVKANNKWYYFGARGAMVTGLATIGGEAFIFNDDGSLRTISNNYKLNRAVCAIIRDYTGFDVRKAYDYVAYQFHYIKGPTATNFADWQEYYALELVETGEGNCYGYSALFHFLCKAMGHNNTKVIDGICISRNTGNRYSHCWVEVYYEGKTYVCDPVLEGPDNSEVIHSYFITYAQNKAATTWLVYDV